MSLLSSLGIVILFGGAWWLTRDFRKGYEDWIVGKYGGLTYGFALLAWALSPILMLSGFSGFGGYWTLLVGVAGFLLLTGGFLFELVQFVRKTYWISRRDKGG